MILKIKQMNLFCTVDTFSPELYYLYSFIQVSRFLLPHLYNPISRSSHDETLCCLESSNICDDVMMPHRQRFWAPSRGIITWSYFLFILNFLLDG